MTPHEAPHTHGAPRTHEAPPAQDRIRLSGIRARGFHGVFPEERRDGQEFVADVVLHVDTRPAAAEDRLDRTVHYGELAEAVASVLSGPPVDLLETVAERIAALALTHPVVAAVEVVVHKPQAPITVPFGDVSVEVRRSRTHPPVVAWAPRAQHQAPQDPPPQAEETAPHAPTDRLDAAPAEPVEVVLAIGSNLGASQDTLRQALLDLDAVRGLQITAVSPLARTAPVGGPEQPDYLNAVLVGVTTLAPRALLHACQEVETRHGRVREERWGARTLDVDLITYGPLVASADDLDIPHPRAHQRAFVLQPWAQVQPDAVLPGLGGGPVGALARTAPDLAGVRWLALDWWRTADQSTGSTGRTAAASARDA